MKKASEEDALKEAEQLFLHETKKRATCLSRAILLLELVGNTSDTVRFDDDRISMNVLRRSKVLFSEEDKAFCIWKLCVQV